MQCFITGTDTGVGKTYVSCLILKALRLMKGEAIGYKPVVCGERDDAIALCAASGLEATEIDLVNPIWLKSPLAPLAAGLIENIPIDPASLLMSFRTVSQACENVIVEGVGGWKVPITSSYTTADLAVDLNLPVLVVADNRLGAINHCLLTVESVRASGLPVLGVILNHVGDERDLASISNRQILEGHLPCPVLGEVAHGDTAVVPEDWAWAEGTRPEGI
ncbi:MAG: dethiobiotin synthase [Verrucomicrobiota bacterium]